MNKKLTTFLILLLVLSMASLSGCTRGVVKINGNTMMTKDRTFAVILDMENYPDGYDDLKVDFINSNRMKVMLVKIGCPEKNILIKQDNIDSKTVDESLAWLEMHTKAGDNIFFYIFAHGSYIEKELSWNETFPEKWKKLNDRKRMLIVDACNSEKFIHRAEGDTGEGIAVSVCKNNELSWCGVESEGLPIIGSVFTYYFSDAVTNPEADKNNDKYVSFEEAVNLANSSAQTYMKKNVFTVPAFLDDYHAANYFPEKEEKYPNAVIQDDFDGELLLYKVQ